MGPFAMSRSSLATTLRRSVIGMAPRALCEASDLDAVIQRLVEPNERLAFAIVEIDRVFDCGGVVAFAHQRALGVLEGGGDFQIVPDPQKDRTRIVGQAVNQVRPEG